MKVKSTKQGIGNFKEAVIMLSGTRLRGSRTKRAEKYVNEDIESMLVSDAESIKVFVENTPSASKQDGRETLTKENPSSNIKSCNAMLFEGGKWKTDLSPDVFEERKTEQVGESRFVTDTTTRSSRRAKDPAFLIEDKEPCFSPKEATTATSPRSDCENDPFETNFDGSNTRKAGSRFGKNVSQTTTKGWELGSKKDEDESNFKFSNSTNRGVRKHSDGHFGKTVKNDLIFSQDDLVFSDIFKDKTPDVVENWLQLRARRQQTLRRARSQPHSIVKNRTKHEPFTDLSLSEDGFLDKSTSREFPWGTFLGVSQPGSSTLRDRHPEESLLRSSLPGESIVRDSYSGKDNVGNKIPDEEHMPKDPAELMEDSEDVVNKLNNTKGDGFTDKQGERSFVCLVDQLTDVRVRQKFDANYAGRRRHAVCEELEKIWVWNDRCLYEYRRDLNVRTALSYMFS